MKTVTEQERSEGRKMKSFQLEATDTGAEFEGMDVVQANRHRNRVQGQRCGTGLSFPELVHLPCMPSWPH